MSRRLVGFYWVKLNGEWHIAEYTTGQLWYMTGIELGFHDDEFEQIDYLRLERE